MYLISSTTTTVKELTDKNQNRPNVEVADKLHIGVTKKVEKPKLTKLKRIAEHWDLQEMKKLTITIPLAFLQ